MGFNSPGQHHTAHSPDERERTQVTAHERPSLGRRRRRLYGKFKIEHRTGRGASHRGPSREERPARPPETGPTMAIRQVQVFHLGHGQTASVSPRAQPGPLMVGPSLKWGTLGLHGCAALSGKVGTPCRPPHDQSGGANGSHRREGPAIPERRLCGWVPESCANGPGIT
jgi:hypothetical protein